MNLRARVSKWTRQVQPSRSRILAVILGVILTMLLCALCVSSETSDVVTLETSPLETSGVILGGWCTWLLAINNLWGWVLGLGSSALFALVFYRASLYADFALQIFFLGTCCQAIWTWLHVDSQRTERPVTWASRPAMVAGVVIATAAVVATRIVLIEVNGAAPLWDAITAIGSAWAQVFMMMRWVQCWHLWITVDLIYIPLYASRGLWMTAGLYVVFLMLAIQGLYVWWQLAKVGTLTTDDDPAEEGDERSGAEEEGDGLGHVELLSAQQQSESRIETGD